MTFREFTGKNVEEAIRTAMKEFASDLSDLDIEILSQGSRGILGVGGEEARILAAPKSAVAAASSVRPSAPPEPPAPGAESSAEPGSDVEAEADAVAAPAPRGRGRGRARTTDPAEVVAEAEPAAVPSEPSAGDEAVAARGDDQATERAAYEVGETGGAGELSDERRRGRRGGRGRNGRERPSAAPRERDRDRDRDRPAREPAPFVPAKPLAELSEEERKVLEDATTVLEELLRLMGVPGTVEVAMGHEASKLNVKGDGLGLLIGRRGEKLASLQHIVNLMVARGEAQHHRIMVDVENYRGRREDQLRDVAERAAKRVLQTGKIIQLEAMPAVERRIVHMALVENPRIRTQSVGVEPNRRIVILPAGQVEPR